ncbi:MAG: hypothetical protein HYS78_02375 [Parcubacteria group bacterium]|nr:hypothetical protein [Parcubacteria group bacterium]
MSKKETAFLIILFAVVLSLSVSGKLSTPSSSPFQTAKPKIAKTVKPNLLPLDIPDIKKEFQAVKSFVSPTPIPLSMPVSEDESFQSIEELQQSKNILLDLTANGIPFGGKVRRVTECSFFLCDGAYEKVLVGPPRGGTFMTGPNTALYQFYDISEGNWVLGLGGDDIICYQFRCVKEFCACFPNGQGPQIEIIGTSE